MLEDGFVTRHQENGMANQDTPAGYGPVTAEQAHQFTPVTLTWRKISYSVPAGKSKGRRTVKQILENQTGKVEPSEILAIMGSSGSGKTSLLNALAGRTLHIRGASLTGHVLINGQPRDKSAFKRISAYVQQEETLYCFLTVRETVWLAAELHLPPNMPKGEKEREVTSIIQELGLTKAQNTIIGNERTRGISGGEKRRVMIAVELISSPSIIFLDEPTSGLDSFQAQSVVAALKDLARAGRTIVTVIHQPRSSIFQMFDKLLLLSEGHSVYFGLTAGVVPYFELMGHKVPSLWNAADFLLDTIALDYRTPEAEEVTKKRIQQLQDNYRQHSVSVDQAPLVIEEGSTKRLVAWSGKKSSWIQQLVLLSWRSGKDALRNNEVNIAKFAISAVLGLLLGAIYSNVGHGQQSIQDKKGILFFVCINQAFGLVGNVTGAFPKERKIVDRERASNSYHISAYYMAKLIGPLTLGIVVYWIAGLRPEPVRFLIFLLVIILESVAAVALGMAISSASSSVEVANVAATPVTVVMLLCGGFYISVKSLPPAARWVADLSLMKWAFQALIVNEFEGTTLTCTADDKKCYLTGEEAIRSIGFGGSTVADGMWGMLVLIGAYHLVAYLLLRFNKARYQPMLPPESK